MSRPPRILVIRPGALGDTIVTEPVVAALRRAHRDAHLEIAGRIDYLPLLVRPGGADTCLSTDAPAFSRLFADGALDWPRRDLVVAFLVDAAATLRRRLSSVAEQVIVHDPRPPDDGSIHIVDHLLRSVEVLGIPGIRGRPVVAARGSSAFREAPIVLHPGSGGRHKLWPPERWAELITELAPTPAVLTAGPADNETVRAITAAVQSLGVRPGLPQPPIAVDGRESPMRADPGAPARLRLEAFSGRPITELAALLAGARLYVGCDSGVSHLAAAVGAPTIAVFGPTDPLTWAPRGPLVRTLRGPGCSTAEVTTDDVLAAAADLIAAARERGARPDGA
jgi:ADP-heptose:LPS heptosyltransferase